jgi:4,5-DOPA dioxygenase extradiol
MDFEDTQARLLMATGRVPAAFISDFGPMPALEDDDYTASLKKMGQALPRPSTILVMSGHWEAQEKLAVTAAKRPGVIHDFSGFSEEFYKLDYPCPGNPDLARDAVELLSEAGFSARTDPNRGLDHGAWVPLSRLYPKADLPVVQITVPSEEDPRRTFQIGKALAPLRERGVLLLGAGAVSHNLHLALVHQKNDPADEWAIAFNEWLSDQLQHKRTENLLNYRRLAPAADLAAPTAEHMNPFFYVLGAGQGENLTHFYEGIRYGNGVLRSFALGL